MENDKYNLTISNGALNQLKSLAAFLGIPETELHQVVAKGMKLLEVAKSGKIYLESPDGSRYQIDVKKL